MFQLGASKSVLTLPRANGLLKEAAGMDYKPKNYLIKLFSHERRRGLASCFARGSLPVVKV